MTWHLRCVPRLDWYGCLPSCRNYLWFGQTPEQSYGMKVRAGWCIEQSSQLCQRVALDVCL